LLSIAMLWTHLNWPAIRPPRPHEVTTSPFIAQQGDDLIVGTVGDENESLCGILR